MAKYKVGEKVRILDGSNIEDYTGGFTNEMENYIGKILTVEQVVNDVFFGRTAYIMAETWYKWDERGLAPVNQTVVIYRNGFETVALDKRTGNKAIARCNPADEYEFGIGAKLALERLFPSAEKPAKVEETKKKPKFKIGDRVVGNKKATEHYGITKEGWTGVVTEVCDNYFIADIFSLEYDYFDLCKFIVGDKVKVTNGGEAYTLYHEWITKHVDDLDAAARYRYGYSLQSHDLHHEYRILALDSAKAYIEDQTDYCRPCYLVGFDGLKLVEG